MNREEKRKYKKQLISKGYSGSQADTMIMIKEMQETRKFLKEGQAVKLDVKSIKSHPDYPRLTSKYKDWVELHCEDVFTVEYDEKYNNNPSLVLLKEDTTVPKWLFWEGNLIEQ